MFTCGHKSYKNWPNSASFCLFSFFSHYKYSTNTINDKSVDGVLGTRTRGGRIVGADESTELWTTEIFDLNSVTGLGDFRNFLENIFFTKVAEIFGEF